VVQGGRKREREREREKGEGYLRRLGSTRGPKRMVVKGGMPLQ